VQYNVQYKVKNINMYKRINKAQNTWHKKRVG